MLTAPARPAYRPYRTRVTAIAQLTPHFTRVTLHGESLRDFGTAGLDQRIKLLIPFEGDGTSDIGADAAEAHAAWYDRWRELPDAARNPLRTYTVRAVRPAAREIDVDVVVHEALPGTELGPAALWMRRARPGDELIIVGPDEHGPDPRTGIDWRPGAARRVLLVADETAVPAACAILEQLPAAVRADAILEVPAAADIMPITSDAELTVRWLARDRAGRGRAGGNLRPGSLLPGEVEAWAARNPEAYRASVPGSPQPVAETDVDSERLWDVPEAPAATGTEAPRPFYAWLAGEQAAIGRMRRHLVSELGIQRRDVAFMGYWRYGVADIE